LAEKQRLGHRRASYVEDRRETESLAHFQHRNTAPAVAKVNDVVIRSLELPSESALERPHSTRETSFRRRHAQKASAPQTLYIGLVASAQDQNVDQVLPSQRMSHVPQLDAGSIAAG
jgi:hypothetical protein